MREHELQTMHLQGKLRKDGTYLVFVNIIDGHQAHLVGTGIYVDSTNVTAKGNIKDSSALVRVGLYIDELKSQSPM